MAATGKELEHLPQWAIDSLNAAEQASGIGGHIILLFGCVFSSYLLGFVQIRLPGATAKHLYSIILGVFMGWAAYGPAAAHLAIVPLVGYAFSRVVRAPGIILVWSLGYLSCCHIYQVTYNYLGYRMDFTMALMVTAVKTMTYGYNISDGQRLKKGLKIVENDKLHAELAARSLSDHASPIEFMSFAFHYASLLFGPAFEIKTYLGVMNGTVFNKGEIPSTVLPSLIVMGKGLFCIIGFILQGVIPTTVLGTPEFAKRPVWNQLVYGWAACCIYRWQFFLAFYLAEGSNVASGLGYRYDAKLGKVFWDGITNAKMHRVELASSVTTLTNNWNINVNIWLKYHVYARVSGVLPAPITALLGGKKLAPMIITRVCSAFWHGFYSGYYFFFLSALFAVPLDDNLKRIREVYIQKQSLPVRVLFNSLCFLCINFSSGYFGLAFSILELNRIWRFWSGTYFAGHVVCIALGFLLSLVPGTPEKKAPKVVEISGKKQD